MERMVSYPDGEQGGPADFLNKALANKQAHKTELDEQGKGRSHDSEPKHKLTRRQSFCRESAGFSGRPHTWKRPRVSSL